MARSEYILKTAPQNPQGRLRLDPDQYSFLRACAAEHSPLSWNKWRQDHAGVEVQLDGADLRNLDLRQFDLSGAHLTNARLEGADMWHADLRSAWLQTAHLDSTTSLWKCRVDRHTPRSVGTNVRGTQFESTRIDVGTRQLLEYNVRRMNWEEWYRDKRGLTRLVRLVLYRPFWAASDYGCSGLRVLLVFLLILSAFTAVYSCCPQMLGRGGLPSTPIEPPLDALYFSVVAMTTLGFGDIVPASKGALPRVLVMLQVLSGYFLLGALLTRLNVLFTAGGPPASFEPSPDRR